jgi:predicted nucleotidyltransferase
MSSSQQRGLPTSSNSVGTGGSEPEEPMPTLGSNNNNNNNNNNEEEEEEEVLDVETLNPTPVVPYSPPGRQEDKGELQKFVENQANMSATQKNIYILMVAAAALSFNLDDWEPYKSYHVLCKQKRGGSGFKSLKPSKELVAREIKRRNPNHKTNTKNTSIAKLMNELVNTLTDQRDLDWIKHKERNLRKALSTMVNNSNEKESANKQDKSSPTTRHDRMRFICLFQDEEIVEAYRKTQEVMVRTQLDGRNSDNRPADFYDLAVAKFNDSTWVPSAAVDAELHEDFAEPVEYPKRENYSIDREKAKAIIAWEKHEISSLLRDYSKSGNGAVNADEMFQLGEEDPDDDVNASYGHFDLELAMSKEGGDDRKNFLRGRPTDILYWWKVLDDLQLITLTCVAMKKELGATSSSRPQSIADLKQMQKREKKRKREESLAAASDSVADKLTVLNNSIDRLTAVSEDNKKTKLKQEKLQVAEKYFVTAKDAPEEYRAMLKTRMEEIDAELAK